MKILDTMEKEAKGMAINTAAALLTKNPEKNVEKLFSAVKKLTKDETQLAQIEGVENIYNSNEATKKYIQNILKTTDTKCLKKFFVNFLSNANWYAGAKRKMYLETEDTKIPFVMLISPSMRCNLRCTGCYAGNFKKEDDIPEAEVERLIAEARELGIYWVIVLGGEPFFNEYLLDIYEKYDDMMFTPFTNGTLINERTADRLKELGNVFPMISLDGWEESNDKRRGKGIYKKVMTAMDLLKERGILFGVSTAVSMMNFDDVTSEEFIQLCIDKGSKMSWYFQFMPVGKDPDFNMMLTPEKRRDLGRKVSEMRSTKPYFAIDFFNDAPYVGGCIAGKYYFHVNTNEDVEPCIFSHFAADNLKEGKHLIDVFRSPFFKELRARQPYTQNMLRPCSMIDNPNIIGEICEKTGAKPTDEGGYAMLNDANFKEGLNKLADNWKIIADEEWKLKFNCKGNEKFSKG